MIIKQLFIEGGSFFMTILTVEFILLILAAWKAPAWVKETGLIALITCLIFTFLSLIQAFGAIQSAGDISMSLFCGGMKVALIPIIYGSIIYLVSLILRIIQKPRI
ncbi:MAG: hypothetical protein WCR82_00545 [Bacteroidales bacterium]|jgi:hypothetical protein